MFQMHLRSFLHTVFRESPQYQISWKCFQWDPRWYMEQDRQMDGHNEASLLCEHAKRIHFIKNQLMYLFQNTISHSH
jgi:hypothetical protein